MVPQALLNKEKAMLTTSRRKNFKPYRNLFDSLSDYGTVAVQPVANVDFMLDGFLNELDRTINDYVRPNSNLINRFGALESVPRANISKSDRGVTILLAVPGLSRSDFNISVENSVLTVSAKQESEVDAPGYKEFDYGSFERSWTLPKSVDVDRIEANYEAGVLMLEVPYEKEARGMSRKIEVK
jgi:HSP20 family protein